MTEARNRWEGQVVNGIFRLRQYVGGCETSAVFLTECGEREVEKAAIKLIPASPEHAELQLSLWGLAAKLSHPHLIRLFQMGRCQVGGVELLYLVMEYAEENLSEILPERPLTPAETREILAPILDALAYVHSQGFVHGHIKPANIMRVEDQLRISADGLCRMNESRGALWKPSVYDAPEIAEGEISAAADVWSLGMTLVEALTQRLPVWQPEQGEPALPNTLPAPFLELAGHCLRRDFRRRCTIADIVAHMRQPSPPPESRTGASRRAEFAKWRYVVLAVTLGVVLAAVLVGPRLFNRHPENRRATSTVAAEPGVQPEPNRKPVMPEEGQSTQSSNGKKRGSPHVASGLTPVQSEAGRTMPTAGLVPGEVIHQVLPDVPFKARDTITGKVKVSVRVSVDPSGRVVRATFDSSGPSRYFAGLALQAARGWKFRPAKVEGRDVSSEWVLRFGFGRAATRVTPAQTAP